MNVTKYISRFIEKLGFSLLLLFCLSSNVYSGPAGRPVLTDEGIPASPYQANELTPYPIAADAVLDGPASASACLKQLPGSYKAFYISHYGRHGSRTENNISRFTGLMKVFENAKKAGLLTERGDSLCRALEAEWEFAEDRLSFLTPLGVDQLRGIALRMASTFPKLFSGKAPEVDCRSSRYPRCILSMTSFTSALNSRFPALRMTMEASERMSKQLNFHNPQQYYDSTNFIASSALASMKSDTTAMLSALFKDVSAVRKDFRSAGELFNALYYAAGMALNIPGDINVFKFFNADVLEDVLRINNDHLYLDNCNGKRWGDVCLRSADRLVNDFVSRADAAIEGKGYAADLRFGHDGAILTLTDRIGHPDIPDGLSEDDIKRFYMASVIPMGANLQLIFFRRGKSPEDVLVLCMLNEKAFAPTGLTPEYGHFCRWIDLRKKFLGEGSD